MPHQEFCSRNSANCAQCGGLQCPLGVGANKTTVADILQNSVLPESQNAVRTQDSILDRTSAKTNDLVDGGVSDISIDMKPVPKMEEISVGGEIFEVVHTPPPGQDYCTKAADLSPCYPVCCDSVYAKSLFCRSVRCF